MIEYADLIGKPFKYGGRGPDSYDCWGLLMELYSRKGIQIPDFLSPTDWKEIAALMEQNMSNWTPCEPHPGCAIHMKMAQHPHHVAFYLGRGTFIHTFEGDFGVKVDRTQDWERNIVGCYEYSRTD